MQLSFFQWTPESLTENIIEISKQEMSNPEGVMETEERKKATIESAGKYLSEVWENTVLSKKSGTEKFKDYDYVGAIEDFNKALETMPKDIAIHFNLACAYSLTEQVDKSLSHLKSAIKYGFDDFEKIKTHDALAYLRIQKEYEAFEEGGFKLETQPGPTKKRKERPVEHNLLEELKRLALMRAQGLLSEEEFAHRKRNLLG